MPRPVTLFTGQWADLPIADLAARAAAGDSTVSSSPAGATTSRSIGRSPTTPTAASTRQLLERHGLGCWALGAHLVGQAVCDRIDARHQAILPPDVWGDGSEDGVRQRAAERMKDTARAAARFGVTQVNGFTGSAIWHLLYSFPPNDFDEVERGYEAFAEAWSPILDVFDAEGVRFGLEVHPTEIAYDFVTTEKALAAVDRRPAFGINLDPSHFAHQHLDTAQFALEFADRIYHVHVKDSKKRLDGAARSSDRTSTSGRRPAAGTSSRPATATWTSRRSSGRSTASATTGRSRSSGRTRAWIASTAPRTPSPSSGARTSPRRASRSTPRCSESSRNRLASAHGVPRSCHVRLRS